MTATITPLHHELTADRVDTAQGLNGWDGPRIAREWRRFLQRYRNTELPHDLVRRRLGVLAHDRQRDRLQRERDRPGIRRARARRIRARRAMSADVPPPVPEPPPMPEPPPRQAARSGGG
jgi:hypothetical protein